MKKIETAEDLDLAVLERQAMEEIGAVAEHWAERLPEHSNIRTRLIPLSELAPQDRQEAA